MTGLLHSFHSNGANVLALILAGCMSLATPAEAADPDVEGQAEEYAVSGAPAPGLPPDFSFFGLFPNDRPAAADRGKERRAARREARRAKPDEDDPGEESVEGPAISTVERVALSLENMARRLTPEMAAYLIDGKDVGLPEEPVAEAVIGDDNRIRIERRLGEPYYLPCMLRVKYANDPKEYGGTGFFVSGRTVVTAAHVIFDRDRSIWADRVTVYAGMNGWDEIYLGKPLRTMTVGKSALKSNSKWIKKGDAGYDYGAIILPDSTLGGSSYRGLYAASEQELLSATYGTSGYPGDKLDGTAWVAYGSVTKVTATQLFYDMDTFEGQSGGPIFHVPGYWIVGIHTRSSGGYFGNSTNEGVRLTKGVLRFIKSCP